MRRSLSILFLLLVFPALVFGAGAIIGVDNPAKVCGTASAKVCGAAVTPAVSSCSYVHCNGFETQADDDDWTTGAGAAAPDYDSTSFSPEGLESMQLTGTNPGPYEGAYIAVTERAETWITFYIRFNDNNSATKSVVLLYNTNTLLATLSVEHDQKWKVQAEGGTLTAGQTFAANTGSPYFKLRFKQGTGANAEIEFWASTTGAPGSWGSNQSSTDGTSTTQVNKVLIQNVFETKVFWIDIFKENSADITDAR